MCHVLPLYCQMVIENVLFFPTALAVSGGPDSVALCVLTARWKTGSQNAAACERTKLIDGLLAVVVDHGLRAESTEEANLVRNRIVDMGGYINRYSWFYCLVVFIQVSSVHEILG